MEALILLSSLGVLALLAEIFNFKKALFPLVVVGLVTTLILNLTNWNLNAVYYGMMRVDNYAIAFSSVFIAVALLWIILNENFFQEPSNMTDYYALILFSLTGAVIMVSFTNMSMLFIGIEILSIPMYVMAASNKADASSNEAGFKYLIMGAFATGFLLFGIALIYGATGSFDVAAISDAIATDGKGNSILLLVGVLMMLVGMGFKVSAAPFHFWAPDVYQGAPTPVTAFMATIVKGAAFAAFLRLFIGSFSGVHHTWAEALSVMAALTLLVGNITAVLQSNSKRMLAYSSVAHAGYMLLGLIAMNNYSTGSILFYTIAYSVGSIASFGIVQAVTVARGTGDVDAFNGLAKTNPLLAFVMTVALLSLAGIPPTAGFFAKYYIFTAAFQAGYAWLVLVAIIASLIGVYYYFRIIIAMYFKESNGAHIEVPMIHKLMFLLAAGLTLAFGLYPDCIIRLF